MKVLQVNCVFGEGSTGKIVSALHEGLLKNGIDSVVCYGRGKKCDYPFVYKTCSELYAKLNNLISRITGVMYGGCFFSTNKLIHTIKKEKPDIVHLQCINGYFVNVYRLLKWLKNNKIKTVLTLHAEFMYTGGCGFSFDCEKWRNEDECRGCARFHAETGSFMFNKCHRMWKKMRDSFKGFDTLTVVSVSDWLRKRAGTFSFLKEFEQLTILNGLDCSIFKYRVNEKKQAIYKQKYHKIVFQATSFFSDEENDNKGGHYVLEIAKRNPHYLFLIAGAAKKEMMIPENVILLGKVRDQRDLSELYSIADITLLTSRCETFSMVTAESLCCGTPVVGFKAGAPEEIAIKEYSAFVDYGDLNRLEDAMKKMFEFCNKADISFKAKEKYDSPIMINNYFLLYSAIMKKYNRRLPNE